MSGIHTSVVMRRESVSFFQVLHEASRCSSQWLDLRALRCVRGEMRWIIFIRIELCASPLEAGDDWRWWYPLPNLVSFYVFWEYWYQVATWRQCSFGMEEAGSFSCISEAVRCGVGRPHTEVNLILAFQYMSCFQSIALYFYLRATFNRSLTDFQSCLWKLPCISFLFYHWCMGKCRRSLCLCWTCHQDGSPWRVVVVLRVWESASLW